MTEIETPMPGATGTGRNMTRLDLNHRTLRRPADATKASLPPLPKPWRRTSPSRASGGSLKGKNARL